MTKKNALFGVVAVVLLLFAKDYFFQSEETRVRDVLSAVIKKAQQTATENPIARLQDVRSLGSNFTEEIEFHVDGSEARSGEISDEERPTAHNRKELEQQALAAKSYFQTLEVLMLPSTVTISGTTAKAEAEVHVLGSLPGTEGKFYERHLVTFELQKRGSWKIHKVTTKNLRGKDPTG